MAPRAKQSGNDTDASMPDAPEQTKYAQTVDDMV